MNHSISRNAGKSLAKVRFGHVSRLTLAVALSASFSAPALAQDAEPELGNVSNEIIVTAQFREQNVQSTPIAITAMSGAQLEERGQTDITQIATKAPSVNLHESTTAGPSLQAQIRGIGQSNSSLAFEPGVGVYVDDVYYSTLTGSVLDLLDLERVEVLRGPQGTLAGMNSIGGAIKLYTKRPNGNDGGYVEVTAGSLNRLDVRAGADFTIAPDRLYARIAGVSRNQDGFVKRYDFACTHPDLAASYTIPSMSDGRDCQLGTEGGKSYVAGRLSLRWLPTDNLEININGDITRDDSEAAAQTLLFVGTADGTSYTPGTAGLNLSRAYPMYTTAPVNGLNLWNPATGTSPFVSYSPWGVAGDTFTRSRYVTYATYCDAKPADGTAPYCVDPVSQVDSWGVNANIEYGISDNVKLTSISGYRSFTANWAQDFDASPLSNAVIDYETTNWQFSQEVRLAASLLDDNVDLVVGGFYLTREGTFRATVNQGLLIFTEYDEIPASNWATFANASWRITDKLEVNAGIRYSEEKKTFVFYRGGRQGVQGTAPGPGGPPSNPPYFPCVVDGVDYGVVHVGFCPLNGYEGKFSGNNIDYRAVVQYQWTPDIMTYASIATGFKGGGVNPTPYTRAQAYPFEPESLTAYELGAKTTFLDGRGRLNVSGYVNKYSDFIANVFSRVATAPNEACFMSPDDLTCSFYVNAGKATIKGLEAELTLEPIDGFLIDASAALLDFKYDFLSGCSPALDSACASPSGGLGAGIRYDMDLPFAAERQFSAGAQYTFELGSAGRLTPRIDWHYMSKQETNTVNNNILAILPSYSAVNVRLTWNSANDDWQLAAGVTNLTNEYYYTGVGANNNSGTTAVNPAMPRQWTVSIKRNF